MVLPCTKFHPFVQRIKPLLDDGERESLERVLLTYNRCQKCFKMQLMVPIIQVL